MPHPSIRTLLATLFSLTAAACGDATGPDGSTGGGVSASKLLVELSAAESVTMCEEFRDVYRGETLESKTQYCQDAALYEGLPAACEEAKSICMRSSDYEDELADVPSCVGYPRLRERITGTCTATVADLRACTREDAEREGSVGKKYTCEVAGTYLPEWEGMGPLCAALFDKCPGADL